MEYMLRYILVIPANKMTTKYSLIDSITEKEKPRVELQFLLALLNEPLHQNNREGCYHCVLYINTFLRNNNSPLSMISNNVTYTYT